MRCRVGLMVMATTASLALGACTGNPSVPLSPTAAPTALNSTTPNPIPAPQRTIDALPDTASGATVLVNDKSMVRSRVEEEPQGPETFWVEEDQITVADHVNNRIVTFQNTGVIDSLDWPTTAEGEPVRAVDMAIDGDTFYFLEFMEPFVHVHQRVHGRLEPVRVVDFSSESSSQVDQIELRDGNLIGVTYSGRRFMIEGSGELPPDPVLQIDEEIPSHIVKDGPVNVRLATRHEPVGVQLLRRDSTGSYYLTAESHYSDEQGTVYVLHVYHLALDGSLVRTFTPHRDVDHVPNREFRLVNDQLYQLLVRADSAEVILLHPNSAKR